MYLKSSEIAMYALQDPDARSNAGRVLTQDLASSVAFPWALVGLGH